MKDASTEKVKGVIKNVRYHNQVNGYTVATIEIDYKDPEMALHKDKIIANTLVVVGLLDREPYLGEEYSFIGGFKVDPNHGFQFQFNHFERQDVASISGVISYLSSDIFPEIGKKTATLIAEALGERAIELIAEDRKNLDKVKIPKNKKDIIYQVITDNKSNQEKILFFLNNGLTMEMTLKVIASFGNNVIELVKENPYILMEKVDRIGFKKNDDFAFNLGIKPDDPVRLKALILHALKEVINNSGNTFVESEALYRFITTRYQIESFEFNQYLKMIDLLVREKKIHKEGNVIFDLILYQEECVLAEKVVGLLKNPHQLIKVYDQKDIDRALRKVIGQSNFEYSEKQKEAIASAFTEPIVIITGGPGTGKTTIVHAIIKMFLELNGGNQHLVEEIALLAPTGRAAKRLAESTNINAMTIHKFLGYQGNNYYEYDEDNLTNSRLIIVDEASMMDVSLAYRLFSSMNPNARMILVGDVDQLPSVGPGQVLADLINTEVIKVVRLDKIHRQAENSNIIKLAHALNEGRIPSDISERLHDRTFISAPEDHIRPMIGEILSLLSKRGIDANKSFQILAPMYRGKNGINEINHMAQEILNPYREADGEIDHFSRKFRINDKVIQLVNRSDKQVMNGDIGIVNNFIYHSGKIKGLTVLFDIGAVDYTLEELSDLSHAYAISIHKAQGSEFEIVLIPISAEYNRMLKRKLIYTAITRAKKSLMLIGNVESLKRGITEIEVNRDTILTYKIIEMLGTNLIQINDPLSAFSTLGEKDIDKLSPYDFLEPEFEN
jgi:exodeoxyribonuclease V alpha subunit